MPKYAELIYNGFWYSPEREMLQVIDKSRRTSPARCSWLYKGNTTVVGRKSPKSALLDATCDVRGRSGRVQPA